MKLTFAALIAAAAAQYENMYDDTNWGATTKWAACAKPGQSPIDLKDDFKKVYIENDMQFTGYDKGWNQAKKKWDKKHAV
jgi:hypothetical protein